MIIRVLLIAGILGAALFALRGSRSATPLAIRRLGTLLFAVVASVTVTFPDIVSWLAAEVGVSQAPNLVLYALVLAFLFVSIGTHQRIHALEQRVTKLTRELTLRTSESAADREPTAEKRLPAA